MKFVHPGLAMNEQHEQAANLHAQAHPRQHESKQAASEDTIQG
jgi:hypothetical protein